MASARRRPLLLAHVFAAPLVREVELGPLENERGLIPVKQQNYARERDIIVRWGGRGGSGGREGDNCAMWWGYC